MEVEKTKSSMLITLNRYFNRNIRFMRGVVNYHLANLQDLPGQDATRGPIKRNLDFEIDCWKTFIMEAKLKKRGEEFTGKTRAEISERFALSELDIELRKLASNLANQLKTKVLSVGGDEADVVSAVKNFFDPDVQVTFDKIVGEITTADLKRELDKRGLGLAESENREEMIRMLREHFEPNIEMALEIIKQEKVAALESELTKLGFGDMVVKEDVFKRFSGCFDEIKINSNEQD